MHEKQLEEREQWREKTVVTDRVSWVDDSRCDHGWLRIWDDSDCSCCIEWCHKCGTVEMTSTIGGVDRHYHIVDRPAPHDPLKKATGIMGIATIK